jgi:predicted transcriptional regulator
VSGQLEDEVLAALWAGASPRSAADVQTELGGGLAYTTVVTTLSRLYGKGVLTRHREGRTYFYAPVTDRSGLTARRMRQVLDSAEHRSSVLARFVSDLSADDERTLRDLLAHELDDDASGGER